MYKEKDLLQELSQNFERWFEAEDQAPAASKWKLLGGERCHSLRPWHVELMEEDWQVPG